MTATDKNKNSHHRQHHHNNNNSKNNNNNNEKRKESWDAKMTQTNDSNTNGRRCSRHQTNSGRSESVLSTDSDIRFTRRKLGDSQRCGCVVIAGFLLLLLLAGAAVYVGYTYFRPEPLPEKIFRARLTIIDGDTWTPELTDQKSQKFQLRSRDYRERINLVLNRSDLRNAYEGSEVLALDGTDEKNNELTVHFVLQFDPYRGPVTTSDLHAIFMEEITALQPRFFANLTVNPESLQVKEYIGQMDDASGSSKAQLEGQDEISNQPSTTQRPPRRCEPLKLNYCRSIGYNMTTYPNFLGHNSAAEVNQELITFRDMVDAECFRQAFDFICRLLQPPCEVREPFEPKPGIVCRKYCQSFWNGCGDRLPERYKKYFDCERYPESTGIQSCFSQPGCAVELETNSFSARLCDGVADCPDLSDELTCSFCPPKAFYCGKGRACVSRISRCDGKLDCPDGSDEKDCLSISPLTSHLTFPTPLIPHRPRFYSEGYAIFSEKDSTGKVCAEGMSLDRDIDIRRTVAESLCKALGYERVKTVDIKNDLEPNTSYVRVLDPRASEISFVRTKCRTKQVLYVSCEILECGVQSVFQSNLAQSLPKMASPGDWPWHVALFRGETHVCDGTLISENWVLTTDSCFQGQPKATWLAVFGIVRISSNAPWQQRRRIVGMVKSPVEGSTAALIRLETPVMLSDFIRPVCLPDEANKDDNNFQNAPKTSVINRSDATRTNYAKRSNKINEDTQYFRSPVTEYIGGHAKLSKDFSAEFVDEGEKYPMSEALAQQSPLTYPLPENSPQTLQYKQQTAARDSVTSYSIPNPISLNYALSDVNTKQNQWGQCNTLGWARQREQLQRVQLRLGEMAACENISIATVNSMCAEAAYHKQDCNEEEFAGSPVICLLPDNRRWSLLGISSWRIACATNGVERPRMYDKISSNTAWIRDTINAT